MKNYFLYFLVPVLFFSCALSGKQEVDEAVLSANIYLNNGKCQNAIDVLKAVENSDKYTYASYVQTYASAYACKASFNEPSFFSTDLPKFANVLPLGGMATFTSSIEMDAPDHDDFDNMQAAIDLLLYAGGISKTKDPTVARRAALFNTIEAGNINFQLLFMLMSQVGRYLSFYGDADITGVKGSGSGGSSCFFSYTNDFNITNNSTGSDITADADTVLSALDALGGLFSPGSCTSATGSEGHPFLTTGVPLTNAKRMCQGVVLLNNFFEVLDAVLADMSGSDGGAFNDAAAVSTYLAQMLATVSSPNLAEISSTLSQEKCETAHLTVDEELQTFFIFTFETLFE